MIKFLEAQEQHLVELTSLFSLTGYDLAAAKYNLLNEDPMKYIRDYKLKPWLPITTVAVSTENIIYGMVTCCSSEEVETYSCKRYPHPDIVEIFKPLLEFNIPKSLHVCAMAVNKSKRHNGIGKALLDYVTAKAVRLNLDKISLLVWSCQTSAIKFYLDNGMLIVDSIKMKKIPYSTILYLEKRLDLDYISDYFDSKAYADLQII